MQYQDIFLILHIILKNSFSGTYKYIQPAFFTQRAGRSHHIDFIVAHS
jgi:hypothetical protein